MDIEQPGSARFSVHRNSDGLLIDIPAKRQWFMFGFMTVWLTGWTLGGIGAVAAFLIGNDDPVIIGFLGLWLIGWAIGEAVVASALGWMLFGHERIIVTAGFVTIQMVVYAIIRKKTYAIAHMQNLELNNTGTVVTQYGKQNLAGPPAISFDYGGKTINFGRGLDKAEARAVIEVLKKAIPSLSRKTEPS